MIQKSKDCHNEGAIISLQEIIKRSRKEIILSQVMEFAVLKACLHRLCNLFATGSRLEKKTEIAERLQRSRKGFLEVANQSPIEISRELSFEHAQKTQRD